MNIFLHHKKRGFEKEKGRGFFQKQNISERMGFATLTPALGISLFCGGELEK